MTDTAFVYLTNKPANTKKNIKRYKEQIDKLNNVDFYIAGFSSSEKFRQDDFIGIVQYVFSEDDALSLHYKGKERLNRHGRLIFIPGNVDYIHLLFYKLHNNYQHYYFVEDDVVYNGNISDVIEDLSPNHSDLLCTHVTDHYKNWTYNHLFNAKKYCASIPSRTCFLPFVRITARGLEAINDGYKNGVSGHPEMTWPFLLDLSGCTITDIGGSGSYVSEEFRNKYYKGYTKLGLQKGTFRSNPAYIREGGVTNCLYHPVKPFIPAIRTKFRRLKSIINYYLSQVESKFNQH
ncbi:hypothetical protein ACP3VU_18425 [Vibrio sp. PNB23_22_6]|uniref:hypothetical protein n=1 Tax=Vibrio TaxID=662 RepID=UPI00406903D3